MGFGVGVKHTFGLFDVLGAFQGLVEKKKKDMTFHSNFENVARMLIAARCLKTAAGPANASRSSSLLGATLHSGALCT